MVEGRYEFTGETKIEFGIKLHRIRALVAIAAFGVAAGELGGWIEKQENLSQVSGDAWVSGDARVSGDAWVSGNARVYGDARVSGDAQVSGDARVSGDAQVSGNARVYGDARVSGNARVSGDARVSGNAQVSGNAWVSGDARVSGDAWVSGPILVASRSDGYIFLVTPTKIEGEIVIIAGCRYFTPTQAREHWTKTRGGTKLGEESIAIVGFLEWMAQAQGWIK